MKTLHFFPNRLLILVDDQESFTNGEYVINIPITIESECFMVNEETDTSNAVKVIATSFGSMNGTGNDFLDYDGISKMIFDKYQTNSLLSVPCEFDSSKVTIIL